MKRILPNRCVTVALLTPCGPMVFGIFGLFGMIVRNINTNVDMHYPNDYVPMTYIVIFSYI
jgi:hypothetical protein